MKNFRVVIWAPFTADVVAEDSDGIEYADVISALRSEYGGCGELALDFLDDMEVIDEWEVDDERPV